MSNYTKGELIAEGKTKCIWEVVGNANLVIVENKNDITAFDDPSLTKQFATKGACATTTTSRVFEMLHKAGIKTAFVEQISDTEFVMKRCKMIPLEVVARRYAYGSYLKREPSLAQEPPLRFNEPVIEFFLKTSKGMLVVNGKTIVEGLKWEKGENGGEEDPFIIDPFEPDWHLAHSKKPLGTPGSDLDRVVLAADVLPFSDKVASDKTMWIIRDIMHKVFIALEDAFDRVLTRFIDIKIEVGIDPETGMIVVADDINNDSWRIRDENWQELSKERFRQGEKLEVVEQLYQLVAEIVSRPEFLGEVA